MMFNHAGFVFQPCIIEKRKATQPVKINVKARANEYGCYDHSVLNTS